MLQMNENFLSLGAYIPDDTYITVLMPETLINNNREN